MKGIFLTGFAILLLFNFIYCTANPDATNVMFVGAVTGLLASSVAVGVISGVTILGTGLTGESVKILFGISSLLNMLFQVNVGGFPVGIGLITNILNVFPTDEFMGIGYFVVSSLTIVILASGVMILIGSGE